MEPLEGEVVSKAPTPITIQSVNQKLLKELDKQLDQCVSVEALSTLSDSVAKLNSSYKGNDIFPRPETDEERIKREQREALKGVLSGDN